MIDSMNGNNIRRIQLSVDYIETRLFDDFRVEDAAEIANCSLYHFQRLFMHISGYSVMQYARKRRLTWAAYHLLYTHKRIIDIAMDLQYESQESFTRAFKNEYGLTPGKYRKNNIYKMAAEKIDVGKILRLNKEEAYQMEPVIRKMEKIKVIGARLDTSTSNGSNFKQIPQFWNQFMSERTAERIPDKKDPKVCLGICDDYNFKEGTFSYIIAYEVTSHETVPPGLISLTVPEAEYAVFTAKGKLPFSVQNMVSYIYGEWLQNSDYARAVAPEFEYYDEKVTDDEKCEVDIYIPVIKKG